MTLGNCSFVYFYMDFIFHQRMLLGPFAQTGWAERESSKETGKRTDRKKDHRLGQVISNIWYNCQMKVTWVWLRVQLEKSKKKQTIRAISLFVHISKLVNCAVNMLFWPNHQIWIILLCPFHPHLFVTLNQCQVIYVPRCWKCFTIMDPFI